MLCCKLPCSFLHFQVPYPKNKRYSIRYKDECLKSVNLHLRPDMFIPWEPKPATILLTLVFDSVMILLGENHRHFSFLGWTSWPDFFTVGVGTIQLHRVDNRAPWAKSTSVQNGWTRFFRSQNFINKPFSVVCPCPSEFSTVPWLVFWHVVLFPLLLSLFVFQVFLLVS